MYTQNLTFSLLVFAIIYSRFLSYFIFKISQDFASYFKNIKSDALLVKWHSIENDIYKYAKKSKNEFKKHLLAQETVLAPKGLLKLNQLKSKVFFIYT